MQVPPDFDYSDEPVVVSGSLITRYVYHFVIWKNVLNNVLGSVVVQVGSAVVNHCEPDLKVLIIRYHFSFCTHSG